MYCKYCGKSIDKDSSFCRYCGKPLHANLDITDNISAFKEKCTPKTKDIMVEDTNKSDESYSKEEMCYFLLHFIVVAFNLGLVGNIW